MSGINDRVKNIVERFNQYKDWEDRYQTIIDLGAPLIVILSVIILFQIVQVIVVGALRGAGDVKFVATLSLVSVSIVRPALTYVFAYGLGFGLTGAWMSVLVDQIMRFVISQVRFNSATWTKIKV